MTSTATVVPKSAFVKFDLYVHWIELLLLV